MWLLVRRLLMMFVTAWVMERAVTRWPRLAIVRRMLGIRELRKPTTNPDRMAGLKRS